MSAAICGQFEVLLQNYIRPPTEDDCNIKCTQYATLTYVEDESRSIVTTRLTR